MLISACGKSKKNEDIPIDHSASNELVITKKQFEGEKMQFGKVTEHQFNETIKASGMIDVPTHNKSSVSTFIVGYIWK